MRKRPAPMAKRTPNSPRRESARDSRRLPTLAQAISNSAPIMASRHQTVFCTVSVRKLSWAGFA